MRAYNDILGFDISMDDAMMMKSLEATCNS